jgi:hypothetical protein
MDTHGHATTLGHRAHHGLPLAATLGALGIVYGDIGTSPLYAFKEAAKAASGHAALEPGAVLGVLSLMLWALILVVSLKYAILILRADNRGEGGIMAMLALLHSRDAPPSGWRALILVLGLIGAALLYGDGAITPAISVLSAVEGLKLDAPQLVWATWCQAESLWRSSSPSVPLSNGRLTATCAQWITRPRGARQRARAIAPRTCIRSDAVGPDHDAVMRIGGEAPGGGSIL